MVMHCNNRNSAFANGRPVHVARDYKRGVLRPGGHENGIGDKAFSHIQQKAPEHFPFLLIRLEFEKCEYIGGPSYGQRSVAHVPFCIDRAPAQFKCRDQSQRLVFADSDATDVALL